MTEPMTPELRPFRDPQDRAALYTLFAEVNGQPFGGEAGADVYFDWLYCQRSGGRILATGAFVGERMVSFYGIVVWPMRVDGKDVLAAQSVNSMTHPEFQRRGLFAKLGMLAYRETCHDVPVIFGFPNQNADPPRTARLGWVGLWPVPRFVLPLTTPPLPQRVPPIVQSLLATAAGPLLQARAQATAWLAGQRAQHAGIAIRPHATIPPEADDLWLRVRDDYRVSVLRDAAYLTWRYDRNPTTGYQILGAWRGDRLDGLAVVRANGSDLFVLEFLVGDDPAIQGALLGAIVDVGRRVAQRSILILDSFRRSDVTSLLLAGFLPLPAPRGRFFLVPGVRRNSEEVAAEALFHVNNWRLSYGDADVW